MAQNAYLLKRQYFITKQLMFTAFSHSNVAYPFETIKASIRILACFDDFTNKKSPKCHKKMS